MKKLIILGTGSIGELAYYYFSRSSEYDVVAFSVTDEFFNSPTFSELPVVRFSDILRHYPPEKHDIFVAVGYKNLNKDRELLYTTVKEMGYHCASYISKHATILNDFKIGDNCLILEDNTIQPLVTIGNNVIMWSGNHVGHHSCIGDSCFITSHVVISGYCEIGSRCFLGVNSTLRDGILVGHDTLVGAGSLLTSNADPYGVYSAPETNRSRVPSSRLRKI